MNDPWFIWNETDSRTMGVVVSSYPAAVRGQERMALVTVPGRSGVLTLPEDRETPVLAPVELRMNCFLKPEADRRAVLRWLQGSGRLVLGCELGFCREAHLVEAVSVKALEGPSGWASFEVVWLAQPWRRMYPEPSGLRVVQNGERIYNPGDMRVPAIITVKGDFSAVLTVGGRMVALREIEGGVKLDWESCDCYLLDETGKIRGLAWCRVAGERQFLPAGYSEIRWTVFEGQIDSVSIELNWRFY